MEQFFLDFIHTDRPFAWLYQFLIMMLVSMVPFAPIPVIAAFIASSHSFWDGFIINMLGTLTGSVLLFLLSKSLLRNMAVKYLAKQQALTKYMQLIQTNGFLAVLLGRIIPILPSAGINLIAGISNVRFIAFLSATFLGKLPTILAFSLAGHQMAAGNWDIVLIIALYLFALLLLGRKIKQKWTR